MKINRKLIALVTTTGLVVGAATIAGAAVDPDPAVNVTGCLTTSGSATGKLVAGAVGNAPQRACTATETKVTVSNGDITSVRGAVNGGLSVTGATILSGNVDKSGEVEVGIADSFRLPQACAAGQLAQRAATGTGWVCANPPPVRTVVQARAAGGTRVGDAWSVLGNSFPLPAGKWSIEARAHFKGHDLDHTSVHVDCRLGIGTNAAADYAHLEMKYEGELNLSAVANGAQPFNVSMSCQDGGFGDSDWRLLTITATPIDNFQIVNL